MRRVYVLGAGSSCFAGFPLGKELYHFLRIEWQNTRDHVVKSQGELVLNFVEAVRSFLPDEGHLNNDPDMEFVLSLTDLGKENGNQEEASIGLVNQLKTMAGNVDLGAWDLIRVRKSLQILVASYFMNKSDDIANQFKSVAVSDLTCIGKAWTELINPGDILITFNWDLLQEVILWNGGKWACSDGYGIQAGEEEPSSISPTIILKLHGSCNWALRDRWDSSLEIDYADHFFCKASIGARGSIRLGSTADYGDSLIIPSYLKDPRRIIVLRSVWDKAEEKLKEATDIVVIGYSLPHADGFAKSLFQRALQANRSLKSIELVLNNKDEDFKRWQAICPNIHMNCTVPQTFEEYVTQ